MQSDSPTPDIAPQDHAIAAPGNPPRELTPAARRAIWTEPRVRRWWLLAIVILLLFAAYTVTRVLVRQDEIKLIRDGQVVTATVLSAGDLRPGAQISPTDVVQLGLHFPTATEQVSGYLASPASIGKDIKLHVDRVDHTHWTDRTEATPLLDSLFVGLLVSPLAPLLFIFAYLNMRTAQKCGSMAPNNWRSYSTESNHLSRRFRIRCGAACKMGGIKSCSTCSSPRSATGLARATSSG